LINQKIDLVFTLSLLFIAILSGCEVAGPTNEDPLFELLSSEQTGIYFSNDLHEGLNTNVLMYEYFYNGGGVAVGDINGDDLEDLYFTGNMTSNRLYLNKGNMQFEDVTLAAGVAGREGPWKTGVSMADVNGDDLLDVYVCYSGNLIPDKRRNELFINKGVNAEGIPQFEEQAREFGLDHSGTSTQAVFFDYDKDNDLDMFLLNHNVRSLSVLDEASTFDLLTKTDSVSGVRLYENNKNFYFDVTDNAGIKSSPLTYGLGAGIADVNQDGWPDIYVSNDYAVPDFLYINNRDGTFTDQLKSSIGHTSHFSMGNNISDINNDGLPDIYTLDMLPEDNRRQKLLVSPDNYEKFDLNLKTGFHYQYMRNMLHVNNGNGTFSEIGQLAGISNTDWSWAPLFADFDNDGWKDLFVTNGFVRDFTNLDFTKYMGGFLQNKNLKRQDILHLVQEIPSTEIRNYMYRNVGDLSFKDIGSSWGFDAPSKSNGAAYSDLDNDGDLDLVVNNINQPAFVYQNKADRKKSHFLKVKLEGLNGNTQGVGAKIYLYQKGTQQYLEQMPAVGYQSSVSPILHFGLGTETSPDSLLIIWPGGRQQLLYNIKADQKLVINEKDAVIKPVHTKSEDSFFKDVRSPVPYRYSRSLTNDFKRQPLMVSPHSFNGPCLIKGDVNNDGLEDIYAGGENGSSGKLFIQRKNGEFVLNEQRSFETDRKFDDADAVFFDANKDGFVDLYVSSGGYANYLSNDPLLQDRLYFNDGRGNFSRQQSALPKMEGSKGCVRVTDINGDSYPDLFVGGRVIPGRYPETPPSYLLINDGKGQFTDRTEQIAPEVRRIGMVSDAAWVDLNKDRKPDLIMVGEWMPVSVMINDSGKLVNKTKDFFAKEYSGWWNSLLVEDFNNDGEPDLVVGKLINNSRIRIDKLLHVIARSGSIPILHTAISSIESEISHGTGSTSCLVLASLNLIEWIFSFYIVGARLPRRPIEKDGCIKSWIPVLIGRTCFSGVVPFEAGSIHHFIVVHKVLNRSITCPVVISIRSVVSAYPGTFLFSLIDKIAGKKKFTCTTSGNDTATSSHRDNLIV